MLEFKMIQELKPNEEIFDIIKTYNYKIINCKIKTLLHTFFQFIESFTYIITYPTTPTILEYRVNEINNKSFYIQEHNEKCNLEEIKQILVKSL